LRLAIGATDTEPLTINAVVAARAKYRNEPDDHSLSRGMVLQAGETVYAGVFVLEPVETKVLQFFRPGGPD
jgi:hypothetical protein